ncbi:photosystem II stability/assembly factor-like uncharacterized protein [Rhodothalassium salexigens DSM 2132]|uniref:Photosystem II stability/assembly factor-like uncharacterized protein n=1 Tax=Rhodothalassium salexigens DSM 2132 TaxID=1188247 RepID=A0A4R2PR59_RHOSA|nr:glycosyl hydrolase [Rhodothalassium salexigens]MBB4210168.1 photosystem II stability/assembly factor-like uncharacterized protein [Rhodothalassium salexigens DSM 2132]MBK1639305.1 glycosyl hydrolase [Rhodothalassium salexigens DSM 2132]TCP38332.1 photosystem II stability/assembly factor-like uncharacterized protein [Rhodothalassium salexigens DSM 2132]
MKRFLLSTAMGLVLATAPGQPQAAAADGAMASKTFAGVEVRNIGPALMSGRIADIAIDPQDVSTWYVAVGSGGVWKTVNNGTTWTPLFDDQPVYSIGDVTLDPSNPHRVWVGTGENVGGRHVGFGDGVYRSDDGGQTWTNMGLETSEHISTIVVHPDDGDTVFVAAQGPLWSQGGDRGLYKTTDGGETWTQVLSAGPWTGVTDVVMDPRNPDRLYAATWQRHRTVASYMGGGPETALYKSEDGGETWEKLTQGLPTGNLGKIGLALAPENPDIVYAAIETNRRKGGIWKSTDRGASWQKQSDTVSGGTGPHYYQELYAHPHIPGRLYLVDATTQVSDDGGKTFRPINNEYKHGDDHAIAFRPDDPDYILVGSDGGVYESHDGEKTWRFIDNLPVTQFYKVAVDDTEPFYTLYGGTQDNNTQGGPSRTDDIQGITNSDWFINLFADGHQPATEPGNPDIVYSEWQQGNLVRVDRTTGELVHIQPQAKDGEPPERFNWDAPIKVSAHQPTRLYYASQRLWRSDDRGDSWTALSGNLTRDQDPMTLPFMGRQWSWDAPWDMFAMSNYNTITSIAESPLDEDLLYVGTDDGLIQVTTNGGKRWRKIEVSDLPGVPETAFVNDIKADRHDRDTVYVALDNHKYGDFKPYLLKSTNRGRSWTSLAEGLPDKHLVWRVVQDGQDADLLFAGTEFGLFFTVDGGETWVELDGGVPTIAFRDLAIQERETDLVGASFGRGMFILDDYAFLRDVEADDLEDEDALLFPPSRRAWWYIERHRLGFSEGASQGHSYFRAPNPPFGATFTYYLKDGLETREEQRQAREKPLVEAGEDVPFPGFDAVEAERREQTPEIWLVVRDADGNVVRRVAGPTSKGFHRVSWDLRFPAQTAIGTPASYPDREPKGFLAAPGDYTVSLVARVDGKTKQLVSPKPFTVERLRDGALDGAEPEAVVAFWRDLSTLQRSVTGAMQAVGLLEDRLGLIKTAIARSEAAPAELDAQWAEIRDELYEIDAGLSGHKARAEVGALQGPSVAERLGKVLVGTARSTYGPTATHSAVFDEALAQFEGLRARIETLRGETIPALETALMDAGAPWVKGAPLPPVDLDR